MKRMFLLVCACLYAATLPAVLAADENWVPGKEEWVQDGNNKWVRECREDKSATTCCDTKGGKNTPLGEGKTTVACAWITMSTGAMRPGTEMPSGFFEIEVEKPTPETATPASLRYVLGYGIFRTSREETSTGLPRYITALNESGTSIGFKFEDGNAVGVPYVGRQSDLDHRLFMVDAEGWSTTNAPAYYDLYPGDGNLYRFIAATNSPDYLRLAIYRSAAGREETMATIDTEIVTDENQYVRQVLAPSCLANVVTSSAYKYSIIFYHRSEIQAAKDGNGLYVPQDGVSPLRIWTIENPDADINRLRITKVTGAYTNVSDYAYVPASEEWSLVEAGGARRESLDKAWNDAGTAFLETRIVSDAYSNVLSKSTTKFTQINGAFRITEEVSDPDGEADKTTYTRFTAAVDGRKLGFVKKMVTPDGSWTTFDYDVNGYKTQEISGWKDSPLNSPTNQAVYYSYTPVAPNDAPAYNDQRPRTVTRKINGQTVGKTFYAYTTNAVKELTEIEEMCTDPSASYGAAGSLRTTKVYYGTNVSGQMIGRLKSVQRPDGTLDTYTYEYGNYTVSTNAAACVFTADPDGLAWRQTITHGTTNSPAGVASKTTREVSVWDEYGRAVMTDAYVYNGSGYDRVGWTVSTLDKLNHLTKTEKSDGTIFSQTWGSNCCGVESQKDASGIEQVFAYDLLNQRISEAKKGTNSPNDDVKQDYVVDALGRRIQTTVSGGGLSMIVSSNTYNTAGLLVQSVDAQGITTTYGQSCCGLESSTIRAGLTNTTVGYLDGSTHYTEQNGERQQTYDYGVNTDGTQWTKVYSGPAWQRTTTDLLGRTIRTERPGYGDITLITEYTYNSQGQLIKTQVSGFSPQPPPTLYAYNELGEQIRSGLDINTNGVIDLAGPDRVSGSDRYFEYLTTNDWPAGSSLGESWWQVSVSKLYPNDNDSTVITNSIQKTRITGLGQTSAFGLLTSEAIATDIRGNQTVSSGSVDRDNKTVTQTVNYPDSTNNAVSVSINGLLVRSTTKTGLQYGYSYDGIERRISTSDPRTGTSTTHYNALGQIDYIEDAANTRATFAYDPATGRKTSTTTAMTNSVYTAYSTEGQMIGTWGATYPVFYEYDEYDRMSAMFTLRDTAVAINSHADFLANSNVFDRTQWFYDDATGLLTNKTYADGKGTSYSYTGDGKLQTRIWARGITTTCSYTNTAELVGIAYSDSTPAITYTHNRIGQQVTVEDSQGIRTFAYDPSTLALSAETLVTASGTNVITRTQDALGRASGFTLDEDYSALYQYSTLGRFASVTSTVASVSAVVDYTYLGNSDLISGFALFPGGTAASLSASRTYEPNRNLLASIDNRHGAALIAGFGYVNDSVGRRTDRIDTGSSTATNTFGYNHRSEVVSAAMGTNDYSYLFDQIGNRIEASEAGDEWSYIANPLNQYAAITNNSTPIAVAHDDDGNMTRAPLTSYGGPLLASDLGWNGENRMTTATNAAMVASYTYDYMGRRIQKVVAGVGDPGSTVTNTFTYDGWNLISESSVFGLQSSVSHYIWGLDLSGAMQGAGGIGGLLCVIENGVPYYPATDANGNITDYVDANGTVVAHREFDPFGNTIVAAGPKVNDFRFWFSSKYLDQETGLYYYGYRHYSPELGRWPSRDPAGEGSSLSLYLFTDNQAVSRIDSLGLSVREAQSACQSIKRVWDEGNDLPPGHHRDRWKKYLAGIKCKVDIECKECCTDADKTIGNKMPPGRASGGERRFPWGRYPCNIKICANWAGRFGNNTDTMLDLMIHELTHCWQNCSDCATHDCKSSICNEIQAYATRNPSLGIYPPDTILRAAKQSSVPRYCATNGIFDDTVNGINPLDAWIIGCKEHGNCPVSP